MDSAYYGYLHEFIYKELHNLPKKAKENVALCY